MGAPVQAAANDILPWKNPNNALVVDAYELNTIDWDSLLSDKRIAAFISKASDGLPESFSCTGDHAGDTIAHCKTMWRKYAVSRELFQTRRLVARAAGLLWGSYHLARPGNPVDQANHFLEYADPKNDEMMILDLEGIDPEKFMSLEDAQIFVGHIRARTGRYPVLYTNHNTARYIAAYRKVYPVLARLPIWYARYKPDVKGVFPMGNWDNYLMWQFSSGTNCSKRHCPYRVPGTLTDIDVNVAPMSRAELVRVWARGTLLPAREPDPPLILAKIEMEPHARPGTLDTAVIGTDAIVTSSIPQSAVVRTRRDF
ncbi:GH25 family lysozyme M1 (1,4-beta-N-acetylmuramidase) [Rhizobium mesoamericanum]|uniref:glycoside hydrolase family 25 protein n=1 Tax=Rhizobium mesoamericanum TaxID=1079800 RepID=UPI00278A6F50|nr:GH25 family lysozyme [Rhizobium mesoamericanum]MDQ0559526.1 GH25 family lysozyme M1 (1,4-beta-N-acetylmuramidase) [Rhizobium mesoamericanum]